MNHLQMIQKYLREHGTIADIPATGFPFVTISRQAGAGGHLLSYILLTDFLRQSDRKLFEGWHVFDRQLCEIVASDPELQATMQTLVSEKYRSEFKEFMDSLFTGRSEQYLEYKKTFEVVRTLATLGKVIVVGRAAACVTRALPMGIHIRLVASESMRIRWMMAKLHIDKGRARQLIRDQDGERRRMVRAFFSQDIDDPLLYDVVWNTEAVPPHVISAAVIQMLKERTSPKKT